MKKPELARRLARQSGVSKAEAADQLDRIVHHILTNLRKGQAAALPGLGKFTPDSRRGFHFQPDQPRRGSGDGRR